MTLGYPQGTPVAPGGIQQHPEDHGLPPGVHPLDPSTAEDASAPPDLSQLWKPGRKPFSVDNTDALGVFQRAASDFSARLLQVNTGQGAQIMAVGRRIGRVSVTFAVPSKLPNGSAPAAGVILGSDQGEVASAFNVGVGDVWVLNVGDSLTIESEASVWVGLINGQTIGWVQVLDLWNPVGGGLGAT